MAAIAPPAPPAFTFREQLIALFAGEVDEGYPVTAPCYRLHLAIAICQAVDPNTVTGLIRAVYGEATPIDTIPLNALEMLSAGWHQWQHQAKN